jgi:hypothetical protein
MHGHRLFIIFRHPLKTAMRTVYYFSCGPCDIPGSRNGVDKVVTPSRFTDVSVKGSHTTLLRLLEPPRRLRSETEMIILRSDLGSKVQVTVIRAVDTVVTLSHSAYIKLK